MKPAPYKKVPLLKKKTLTDGAFDPISLNRTMHIISGYHCAMHQEYEETASGISPPD